jgi:L-lactate dehydrogenase complex protein LldG
MTTAREEVLARIRSANSQVASGGPQADGGARPAGGSAGPDADYRREGDLAGVMLLDRLAERLRDYRALVRRATPDSLGAEIAAALRDRGVRRVVVPPGLTALLPDWVEVTSDDGLSPAELDEFDGVITGAAVAIADTGTIVLTGSAGQGRRAISLVPDYHLCLVGASQVVQLVPEAVARLAAAPSGPQTWISGPSATSDIELERVEGVHGPRTLEIILISGEAARPTDPGEPTAGRER